MKRVLVFSFAFLLCATAVQAQSKHPLAHIRHYASRVLPNQPTRVLTIEPVGAEVKNFQVFAATLRSTDQYCGSQKYILYSPATQQVLIGTVVELPMNGKP